jgi:hypothetical protein
MNKLVMLLGAVLLISCEDIAKYEYGKVINVQSGMFENVCTIRLSDGDRTSFTSNKLVVGDSVVIRDAGIGRVLNIVE